MNAHMTTGTLDFLKKLPAKHPAIDFYFMRDGMRTLVYYEGTKKKVFSSGRTYEIIIENGMLQEKGFVVMNNIPVADDGKATFEDKFKQRRQDVTSMPGYQALRLLRPKKGNTYIVMTQWASKADFDNWKNSDQFKQAHNNDGNVKPPAYFLDQPFTANYDMLQLEES